MNRLTTAFLAVAAYLVIVDALGWITANGQPGNCAKKCRQYECDFVAMLGVNPRWCNEYMPFRAKDTPWTDRGAGTLTNDDLPYTRFSVQSCIDRCINDQPPTGNHDADPSPGTRCGVNPDEGTPNTGRKFCDNPILVSSQ